ncbi:hypothetical protein ACOMHN_004377 [Nucella lapillus]
MATLKDFIVVVFFISLAITTSTQEKSGSAEVAGKSSQQPQQGFKLPEGVLMPRPARWQTRMATRGWMGGPNAARPAMAQEDPEYYPKLFNWLDTVGRR